MRFWVWLCPVLGHLSIGGLHSGRGPTKLIRGDFPLSVDKYRGRSYAAIICRPAILDPEILRKTKSRLL